MPGESIQAVAFSAFIPGLKVHTRSENEATMTLRLGNMIWRSVSQSFPTGIEV